MKKMKLYGLLAMLVASLLTGPQAFALYDPEGITMGSSVPTMTNTMPGTVSRMDSDDSDMQGMGITGGMPAVSSPQVDITPNGDRWSPYPPGFSPEH